MIDFDRELRELEPRLRMIASRYWIDGQDDDDRLQIARVAAWEAMLRYDDGVGVPLRTWCVIVADRRLKDAMTRANRAKRGGSSPVRALSLQAPVPGADDLTFGDALPAGCDSAREVEARAEFEALLRYLRERGPVMRASGLLLLVGCSYDEIAAVTGGHRKQVDNAIQRVKRALREAVGS